MAIVEGGRVKDTSAKTFSLKSPLDVLINKGIMSVDELFFPEEDVKIAIQRIVSEIIMYCPNRRTNLIKLKEIVGKELLRE
jgi:hypothetical protein